jgi:hypothetical protein
MTKEWAEDIAYQARVVHQAAMTNSAGLSLQERLQRHFQYKQELYKLQAMVAAVDSLPVALSGTSTVEPAS